MEIKAVVLARKNGDSAEVALPRTSADLVGYEKENSTATNVKEALDEINDNFQGEAPGIVQRVEVLETDFMPKTGGTFTGLVSLESSLRLGVTSASDTVEYSQPIYGEITNGVVASRVGSTLLDSAPFLDAYFFDSATDSIKYNLNYNFATASLRAVINNDGGSYAVSLPLGIAPHNDPNRVGHFVAINQLYGNEGYTVPEGGTSAVFMIFAAENGTVQHSYAGVLAGGTKVTFPTATEYWGLRGFCWRIA